MVIAEGRVSAVWEAALGRRVVLIEAKTWFDAREQARAMLGGEPAWTAPASRYLAPRELMLNDEETPGEMYAFRDGRAGLTYRWRAGAAPLL